ncbi:erythromycin esterase family protein [Thaumasiovibrio subtropicus]|uniref:erythromycin esterase family protein n=1 Tax=Thaumasiovibrio subtropicus TaxID=1891207 RepID=UPI000B34DC0D|nr:erythromycin esterase family protein [Thaumasiovibrio subtropicus]
MTRLGYLLLCVLLLMGCNSSEESLDPFDYYPISDRFDVPASDLQPIVELLSKYQLIGLGEASHQGGATFETKSRLLKAMHDQGELGFIAMESGLYDGLVAWQNYLTGKQALQDGVVGPDANFHFMLRHSNEVGYLFEYVNSVDQSSHPLILVGYESRISSDPGCSVMYEELETYLLDNGLKADELREVKEIAPIMACPWYTGVDYTLALHNRLLAALQAVEPRLVKQKALEVVPPYDPENPRDFRSYASYWLQQVRSMQAHAVTNFNNEAYHYADAQSADNLRWLRDEWFGLGDTQMAVWGHNIHATKMHGSMFSAYLKLEPEISSYALWVLNSHGWNAPPIPESWRWESEKFTFQVDSSHLASRLYRAGIPNAIIDLTVLDGAHELHRPQNLGFMVASPSSVADGLLNIPVERAATAR